MSRCKWPQAVRSIVSMPFSSFGLRRSIIVLAIAVFAVVGSNTSEAQTAFDLAEQSLGTAPLVPIFTLRMFWVKTGS